MKEVDGIVYEVDCNTIQIGGNNNSGGVSWLIIDEIRILKSNAFVIIGIGVGSSTEGEGEEMATFDIVNSFNLNKVSFGEKSYLYEVRGRQISSTTFHYPGDRLIETSRLLALCLEPLEEVFQERR